MIDGSGFGTPGPCLQKASKEVRFEHIGGWDGIPLYKELETGLEAETGSADSDSKEEAEPGSGMSSFPFL